MNVANVRMLPITNINTQLRIGNIGTGNIITLATFSNISNGLKPSAGCGIMSVFSGRGRFVLEPKAERSDMMKSIHNGKRKAVGVVAHKARAGRSASVMKPEYLAVIENFRLMDDDFMSKCLENAPECIELMLKGRVYI